MNRFEYLISVLEKKFPQEEWLKSYRSVQDDDCFFPKIQQYDKALSALSENSWKFIQSKTIKSFKQNIKRRGKQPFFNLLNEAIAYMFLKGNEFEHMEFIKETNNQRSPDIEFYHNGIKYYCEVKTISESDQQLDLYDDENYNNNYSYEKLEKPFFHKLSSVIYNATEQIPTTSKRNIVFIIVHFDDFAVLYREVYLIQLQEFLDKYYPDISVHIRANIFDQIVLNHGLLPNKANSADAKSRAAD